METLIPETGRHLNDTLSPDNTVVCAATEALDRLSELPDFPLALISITTGGNSQGQKIAAATYLKNYTKRLSDGDVYSSKVHYTYRNQLAQALLHVEPVVLKVLVEAFRIIIAREFVKDNSWPELVSELRSAIQNSNFFSEGTHFQWKTLSALTVLQTIIKPFQYFLNTKLAKEPVPPQLELIAKDILVPLLTAFHYLVDKALSFQGRAEAENERILLVICKCIYFAVRSHMPSALVPILPSFCRDLTGILESLKLDTPSLDGGHLLRIKAGKRTLLIFCALVTRHRKHADRLMPDIINCALRIVKQSPNVPNLDFMSERVISLAFDVISHTLETGPGWRLISPHFSILLESAIFPALIMNEKDISEWKEDPDEYIRKNLPSEMEDISGWNEDLFTARKSAINLLGVISMSKGPPMVTSANASASAKRKKGEKSKDKDRYCSVGEVLVMPFLSKFPIPSPAVVLNKASNDYYGILMAYGGLQEFLKGRDPEYTATLVRSRVLPLYMPAPFNPFLVASANWIVGELAPCLPEDMSAEIYSSLLKSLVMPDVGLVSSYPARASSIGAIAALLENDYLPSEWLALLQSLVSRMGNEDGEELALLFQLLTSVVEAGDEKVAVHIPQIVPSLANVISKHIPPISEPWPQVVERGFGTLAAMTQTWEGFLTDEMDHEKSNQSWRSDWAIIAKTFACLLQQAWLQSVDMMDGEDSGTLPASSCVDDASVLLGSIVRFITRTDSDLDVRIEELLVVWAELIADWHGWEELEDLAIFASIHDVVNLHQKCELKDFFVRQASTSAAVPVPQRSIIEGIGVFVCGALSTYHSATWRACSSSHLLLHVPKFSFETESVKQSLAMALSMAAFSRFKEIREKPIAVWKPLLLVVSSCYLCYPDIVEKILEEEEKNGFIVWARALGYIYTSSFESSFSSESEVKLAVMTLTKVVERMVSSTLGGIHGPLNDCLISLMKAVIHMKEVQQKQDDAEDSEDVDDADGSEDLDDDDVEEEIEEDEDFDDEHEETLEEFLSRYAKAAAELESGMVTEGDVEDQVQELELGALADVDPQRAIFSLMERYHQVLTNLTIPPQLVAEFVEAGPEFGPFFQAFHDNIQVA